MSKATIILRVFLTTVIAISLSLTVKAVDPASEENPYILLMGEAEKAIADGKYDEAAARLIDAMAVEPGNPANLILKTNLGMVYSSLDRDSLAIATLDDVISRAPKMTVARLNRGKINLKINRNDSAIADFSRVIELDSVNYDARYFRGMMSLYGGDKETAEGDFLVLEGTQPERQRTWLALATLYSMTGRDRKAVEYFKKLIENEPAPEYYSALAGCYLAINNLSDASSIIADGLKLYPVDPELYYYRAWLNRDSFRLDDARSDANRAIRYGASPDKVNALFKKK